MENDQTKRPPSSPTGQHFFDHQEYEEVELHDAHVRIWKWNNDEEAAWLDATLGAANWFSSPVVKPWQAAMLLCRFDPNEDAFEDAEQCATEETGPEHLRRLRQRFEALDEVEPRSRTLSDWLDYAVESGLKHHSWVQPFRDAWQARFGSQENKPAMPQVKTQKNQPELATTETSDQRRARRYQMCVNAGLKMPANNYGAMPRGIGRMAMLEGIKRQSFAEDVRAHIAKLNGG